MSCATSGMCVLFLTMGFFATSMPALWRGAFILIAVVFFFLTWAVSPKEVSESRAQSQVHDAQEIDESDFFLEDCVVIPVQKDMVRLETREGPRFVLSKIGKDSYWSQQVDASGNSIGKPIEGDRGSVSMQIKNRVRLRARRKE